tara:strand:+ start:4440 stop:4835 length:396 start_codon:yes stop_codon:yes gene_type:complete
MIFLINANWGISAFLQNKVSVVVLFFFLAAAGSLLRLGFQNSGRWSKPPGTFIANIIASFLMGILLGGSPSAESVTVIGTGFLGSFSTFSTVMMEVSDEVESNRKLIATLYLCLSIIAGVAAAFLGLEVRA